LDLLGFAWISLNVLNDIENPNKSIFYLRAKHGLSHIRTVSAQRGRGLGRRAHPPLGLRGCQRNGDWVIRAEVSRTAANYINAIFLSHKKHLGLVLSSVILYG
jgi:hypothetical protein